MIKGISAATARALLFALLAAGFCAFSYTPTQQEGFWMLSAFTVVLCALNAYRAEPTHTQCDALWAWGLLGAGALYAGILFAGDAPPFALHAGVSFFVLCACVVKTLGLRAMFGQIVPILFMCALLPQIDIVHYAMSVPLRVCGAAVSTAILSFFGFDISSVDSNIYFGGKQIIITAACSGISQLESMLLAALAVVELQHRDSALKRYCHFLLVVPCLLIANTLRLMSTLIGFSIIGEKIYDPLIHELMGYATVVLMIILMYAAGALFTEKKSPATDKESAQ